MLPSQLKIRAFRKLPPIEKVVIQISDRSFYLSFGRCPVRLARLERDVMIREMQLGNGHWETAQFNDRLRVTHLGLGTTDASQNLLKLEFGYGTSQEYNGSGESQTITVPTVGANAGFTATQTYAYDSLNRIQSHEYVQIQ